MAERRLVPYRKPPYTKENPPDVVTSWHFSIEADGSWIQHLSIFDRGRHCADGGLKYAGQLYTANQCTVGFELVGRGKHFPPPQVATAGKILQALVQTCQIPRRLAMLEHSRFSPDRRSDPGPVWMSQHAPGVLNEAYWLAPVADDQSVTLHGYKVD